MSAIVEARGWGWRHAGRRQWAVRGLDLRIEAGERVLLLGASGAGKSTLLTALAGLLRAPEAGDEEGELAVHGRPGLVLQDPASAIVMGRVGDEVAFGLENLGVPADEIWRRVRDALHDVGLSHPLGHPTRALSGGEQQRLAIAGALALRPDVWLLDEPTANLDPDGAELVRATLRRVLADRAATLVLVEHRVGPVLDLVDRVVVLRSGGGVLADGAPGELFARHGAELRRAGVWLPPGPGGAEPASRVSAARPPGEPVLAAEGVGFTYPGADRPALVAVDVTARAGEILAVRGANGSGKSTLALLLASLLEPSSGSVRFLAGGPDRPYARWRPRELVRHVGTVFQDPEHQFVASSVAAELAVGPRRVGLDAATVRARVEELLERLALTGLDAANPFTLSGGEKRRLSVATALATDPRLLVLDEPTFGQDARTWRELVALLADQRDHGRALVAVTHDEDLVAALADRQLTLAHGRALGEPRAAASPAVALSR